MTQPANGPHQREPIVAYGAPLDRARAAVVMIHGRGASARDILTLAPEIGPLPGAVLVRSDVVRKRLFGRAPAERLPEEAYRPEVSGRVFAAMAGCSFVGEGSILPRTTEGAEKQHPPSS